MKELAPGYSFLDLPTPSQKKALVKKNYENLVRNTCGKSCCAREFEQQLESHIMTAPVHEQKFMPKEVLREEILLIQFRRRKEREFKGTIDGHVRKPAVLPSK